MMAKREREYAWEKERDEDMLWCDKEHIDGIRAVEGVNRLVEFPISPSRYTVCFDPRYDRTEVMAEIEAIITGDTRDQEGI